MISFFLFLFIIFWCDADINISEECKTEYTHTYGYSNFHPINEMAEYRDNYMVIKFYVKTSSDAHILLSPTTLLSSSTPVYEIVLGAGQNTFCVIRGQQRKTSLNYTLLSGVLSASEERPFWIKLSNGLIEVGKGDNMSPFLYARDPHPLAVQYICFSTWYKVTGKWKYGCSTTDYEQNKTPITPSEMLHKDMLSLYDPYSRPVLKEDHITDVYIDFVGVNMKVDERNSTLSVSGIIKMKWKDEKLIWNPEVYGNITTMYLPHHQIWQPDISLLNAANLGTELLAETPVFVKSDGSVSWSSPVHLESWCFLDIKNWPNDCHTCELKLGFASHRQFLQMIMNDSANEMKHQNTGSEWELISLHSEVTWTNDLWRYALVPSDQHSLNEFSGISIYIELKRKNYSYKTILTGPMIACAVMVLLSFCLSPNDQGKLVCSCISMIILSEVTLSLGNMLPAPSSTAPHILLAYCSGITATSVSIVISVLVIAISRYEHQMKLPKKVCDILTNKYVCCILFLPGIKTMGSYPYDHLQEENSTRKEIHSAQVNNEDNQQYWVLLATTIDRLSCLVYAIYLSILLIQSV